MNMDMILIFSMIIGCISAIIMLTIFGGYLIYESIKFVIEDLKKLNEK